MRPADNINDLIKKLKLKASPDLDKKVHNDISKALAESQKTESTLIRPIIWRKIMKNPITKLTAAAVIIIAVAISVTILDKSVTPTYAIEQTIEANRGVRFIHLKFEPASAGHVEDIWAQFDDNQELLHLRMNFPDSTDGSKDIVWQEGKAEVWFKAKKKVVVLREENMLTQIKMPYEEFDPKLIVEQLYQAQNDERNQIEIQEPRSQNEPIIITLVRGDSRMVYEVDSETKLLQQLERYRLKDGDYTFLGRTNYLDYNQSDPEIFVLKPPADVIRIDQTTGEVGLEQGNLTDEEVAEEVVRKFFEALIAENYAGAGQFFEGLPADFIQKTFGHLKFLRIISVGPVGPHPDPQTGGLVVPCTVEIEHEGETAEWKLETIGVREVYNQPGRWSIFGGI